MGNFLVSSVLWLQMFCLIVSRQMDPIHIHARLATCNPSGNLSSRRIHVTHAVDKERLLRDIIYQAERIKRHIIELRQFYARYRVHAHVTDHIKLYNFRSALQSNDTSAVLYISAQCIADLLNWHLEILNREKSHAKEVKNSLEQDMESLYETMGVLECQLLAYLASSQVNVPLNVETNPESLSLILFRYNSRGGNFWRDFVVLQETLDLMEFIITSIKAEET